MSTFDRYSIYPSRFGGLVLRDMTDFNWRSATNKSVVIPGGDLHPRAIVNCCADPMATFRTKDFTALGTVNVQTGYGVDTETTAATLLQFQNRVDGAAFATANNSSHVVGTSNKGFLHCTEISAQQDDVQGAQLSMEYVLMSADGVTDPITWSGSGDLTSTPSYVGIWYLGPVYIGTAGSSTSQVKGIQSVNIRTGIVFRAPRADGSVYPQNGSVYSIVPEIRIRTLDVYALTNFLTSPFGHAFANPSTSYLFYFQKGIHGGSREPRASSVHYLVTATTGDDTTDSISVQQIDDAVSEVIIRPTGGISCTANTVIPALI